MYVYQNINAHWQDPVQKVMKVLHEPKAYDETQLFNPSSTTKLLATCFAFNDFKLTYSITGNVIMALTASALRS